MNLNYNQLTGEIPELITLPDLRWLFLNSNSLTGPIPSLSSLTDLTWVDLSYNRLNGRIPDLSTLTSLNGLNLGGNQLTGEIPALSALSKLERLELGFNALDGEIPDLSALTSLERLDLGHNGFTGEIPDLDALINLERLDLGANELTGLIPDLSALIKLTTLKLGVNDLSGEIPDLSDLLSLESLLLNSNQLTGPIPELSTLTQLTDLDLSNNQLTGSILSLRVLSNLVHLDVSQNRLSGPLPDLSSLAKLERLNLSGNSFCLLAGTGLYHPNSFVDAHLKSLNLAECTEADLSDIPGLSQNLTATVANGQVTLSWDGARNAATYELWVWNSIDRLWGSIGGALASTTYTHSVPEVERKDRSYYYQVRARDGNGVSGPWSERLRIVLAPQQFPLPPLSLGLDILYQKYMEVGGVHVMAPSELPDRMMIRTRDVITSMLSTRPDILEFMADYGTRIYFTPEVDGYAQKLPSVFETHLPLVDFRCFALIHEFAHVIHYTLDELPGGDAFNSRLQSLYVAALGKGLWKNAYASWNVREYWAEIVRYWFRGSLRGSVASAYARLVDYDPEAAKLVEEVFGDSTVPAYCMP